MMKKREFRSFSEKLGSRFSFFKLLALGSVASVVVSCSLFKTRPVQEMSDTAAAMRAAKEAQADLIAPVLYREANDWWQRAKAEYKYKNFQEAEDYAIKARKLAERAEFEVLKSPGQRVESTDDTPPPAPPPVETPYDYPTPTGTPFNRAISNPGGGNSTPSTTASPNPQL
jgi:hypothetical protein